MGCSSSYEQSSFYVVPIRARRRSDAEVHEYYPNNQESTSNRDPTSYSPSSIRNLSYHTSSSRRSIVAKGLVGLQNLGNTCFMNCSLQCLSHTIQLVDYFTTSSDWKYAINRSNPLGRNGEVAEAFGELLNTIYGNMFEQDSRYIRKDHDSPLVIYPVRIRNTLAKYQPIFRGNAQHDAQELLAFLLDGLHEDLNQVRTKPWVEDITSDGSKDNDNEIAQEAWNRYLLRNRSIIVDLLQGQLKNTLKCTICGTKSIKFETFMYLSLPLHTTKQSMSLSDCLDEFCRAERLDGDQQWRCPCCKDFRDAEKSMELWSAPPVLIIHLKRFYHDSTGRRYKINALVDFPTKALDLSSMILSSNHQGEGCLYDLYSVSNHHGSLHGGHYTATIRNRFDDNWYVCNDSTNHRIDEAHVCTSDAYVLYFHRRESITRRNTLESSDISDKHHHPISSLSSSSSSPAKLSSSYIHQQQPDSPSTIKTDSHGSTCDSYDVTSHTRPISSIKRSSSSSKRRTSSTASAGTSASQESSSKTKKLKKKKAASNDMWR